MFIISFKILLIYSFNIFSNSSVLKSLIDVILSLLIYFYDKNVTFSASWNSFQLKSQQDFL